MAQGLRQAKGLHHQETSPPAYEAAGVRMVHATATMEDM